MIDYLDSLLVVPGVGFRCFDELVVMTRMGRLSWVKKCSCVVLAVD